jgi:hypothetical protein
LRIQGDHHLVPPADRHEDAERGGKAKGRQHANPKDTVDISDKAKRMHAEATGAARELSPQIKAEIQERIRSGFYDSDEVLNRVARRVVDLLGL